MLIFAADLDNTLIYSRKKAPKKSRCVEWKEGRELSYMSENSYQRLQKINETKEIYIVPITTRSLEQYQRIRLLEKGPELAVVSNGGILLIDGKVEESWKKESMEMILESRDELEKAKAYLEKDENRNFELRNIDDMFLFTKSQNTTDTISGLEKILNLSMVSVMENYNKIYVIPRILDKGLAIRRLRKYLQEKYLQKSQTFTILAAGDSNFDIPMLQEAEYAVALEETYFTETLGSKEHACFWNGKKNLFSGYVLDIVEKYC